VNHQLRLITIEEQSKYRQALRIYDQIASAEGIKLLHDKLKQSMGKINKGTKAAEPDFKKSGFLF